MNCLRRKVNWPRIAAVALAATMLSGCNLFNRITQIGEPPPMTQIQNPTQAPHYRPVSMPMPAPFSSSSSIRMMTPVSLVT